MNSEKRKVVGLLFCATFVFLVIGLPTLLSGCNKSISGSCLAYNSVSALCYGYSLDKHTCKKCKTYVKKKCTSYDYFDCWTSYAKFHYDTKNHSCSLVTDTDNTDQQAAIDASHKYVLSSDYDLLQNKRDKNTCSTGQDGMNLWIVGVFFLCLTSVACVGSSLYGYRVYSDPMSYSNMVSPHGSNLEMPTANGGMVGASNLTYANGYRVQQSPQVGLEVPAGSVDQYGQNNVNMNQQQMFNGQNQQPQQFYPLQEPLQGVPFVQQPHPQMVPAYLQNPNSPSAYTPMQQMQPAQPQYYTQPAPQLLVSNNAQQQQYAAYGQQNNIQYHGAQMAAYGNTAAVVGTRYDSMGHQIDQFGNRLN